MLSSDNESSGLHARVPEHIAYQLRDTGERIPEVSMPLRRKRVCTHGQSTVGGTLST